MQTSVVSLKDSTKKRVLNIDDNFWSVVKFIAFYKQLIEIRMINGVSHSFLHYWAYEVINGNDHTEEQKQKVYELENCSYRFSKKSDEFTDWLQSEAIKRDLSLLE